MTRTTLTLLLIAAAAACGGGSTPEPGTAAEASAVQGTPWTVRDTVIAATYEATGAAQPIAEATLSTKLMGQVTAVRIREGDRVASGQPLVELDADDLAARRAQVEASIREAEAVVRDAETQAGRMRALYRDEAAPKAQLDAAETGLERARAGLATARASAAEVDAMARYATVRAPFDGQATRRFVDPGDFAAPGAPLVTVLDARRLRVSVTAAPDVARGVVRGDTLRANVEGRSALAVVEGVVPGGSGTLYTVNAVVDNADGTLLPGSAATLELPQGQRAAVLVPEAAVIRRGDLTGLYVVAGEGPAALRWVRTGEVRDGMVEVLAGLRSGEVVLVTASHAGREG